MLLFLSVFFVCFVLLFLFFANIFDFENDETLYAEHSFA